MVSKRRFRSLTHAALGLALLVTPRPAAAGGVADCVTKDTWTVARSRQILLYTNASADEAKSLAREFARFSWLLAQESPGLANEGGPPVIAFALEGGPCYDPFRARFEGKPVTGPGHYAPGPLGGMIVFSYTSNPEDLRVIHHEYLHAFTVKPMSNVPVFLREGLAELYSTFQFAQGTAVFGHALPGRCWDLHHGTLLPLDHLLGIGAGKEYYAGDERGMIYAEGWALVQYLNLKYGSAKLDAYIAAVNGGTDAMTAFVAAYPGENVADLPQRLRAGLEDCTVDAVTVPVGHDYVDDSLFVRTAPPAEILTAFGDLLLQENRTAPDEAQAYYDAALHADPHYGPALVGFGMLNSMRHLGTVALPLYQRAFAASSLDATHAAWATKWVAVDALSDTTLAEGSPQRVARMNAVRDVLERGLALDPPPADVVDLYAGVAANDSASALAAQPRLATLHERWPRRADLSAALLAVDVRTGACGRADSLLASAYPAGASDEDREAAQGHVCYCYLKASSRLANAGQIDAAAAAVDRAQALAPSDEMRATAREISGHFDAYRQRHAAVDLYNNAVELARKGKLDEAIAAFQVIHDKSQDASLAFEAGERVEELRKLKAGHQVAARKR